MTLLDPTGRPVRRAPLEGQSGRCPNPECGEKENRVPDRGFGKGAKVICGSCGYEYPA